MTAILHLIAAAVLLGTAWRHRRLSRRMRATGYAIAAACFALGALLPGLFFASKWLGSVLMPAGLLWLALLFGAAWMLARRQRGRRFALAVLVGYWVAANGWSGAWLLRWLEGPFRVQHDRGPFEAVVVLGGGTSTRPDGSPQGSPSGDRILMAARLYHRGETARLVTTGTAVEGLFTHERISLAHHTATLLEELGVPAAAIVELEGPRNTKEELEAVAALVRARGWARVGLVTSAWHLRRAMRQADRVGLAITPIAADFRGGRPLPNAMELLPSAEGLYRTRLATWELLGAFAGR